MIKAFIKNIRALLLKRTVWRRYKIGKHIHLGMRVRIWARDRIEIGDYFYIGHDSQIQTDCLIGNYVMFGNKVGVIGKYDHNYEEVGVPIRLATEIRDPGYTWKGLGALTIIEDDVWVGYGAIIMSGVTIGRGSIIAAGSVVTKNVEPFSIYAGNPARKIKNRFENEEMLKIHVRKFNSQYKKSTVDVLSH